MTDPDETPAIAAVGELGVAHRVVRTEPANSAEESAQMQGIPLAALLRTIVVRRGEDDYLFVLVPAGRRFDWPKLRGHLGVTRLSLPDADEARIRDHRDPTDAELPRMRLEVFAEHLDRYPAAFDSRSDGHESDGSATLSGLTVTSCCKKATRDMGRLQLSAVIGFSHGAVPLG